MNEKIKNIIKIPFKPYWAIKRKLRTVYIPKKYWNDTHRSKELDSLLRVGCRDRSEEENLEMYAKARHTFLEFCDSKCIDFSELSVLEIGCGTGFYSAIILDRGCKDYTGVDISDVTITELRQRFDSGKFDVLDISSARLKRQFDLIIMIDVTQHIVSDRKFSKAMGNIKSMLADEGRFVVTSWLVSAPEKERFYEIKRPMSCYQKAFAGFTISNPIQFRDKYLFSISKKNAPIPVKR